LRSDWPAKSKKGRSSTETKKRKLAVLTRGKGAEFDVLALGIWGRHHKSLRKSRILTRRCKVEEMRRK